MNGARPAVTEAPNADHLAPPAEESLSLDDDDSVDEHTEPEPPFRVPVRVLADSLRQIVGPCHAVLVPHGMFLELEPMQPFLYVPVGCPAEAPATGELTVTLPDGRAVTLRFDTRYPRPLARATIAFLAGTRPVPVAADYRRKWWMLWVALIFALGLASLPLVLSQTTSLDWEFGLQVGAGFAGAGPLLNAAVALFSRRPVFVQLLMMAVACTLVTGAYFLVATAYLAGRQKGVEEAKPDPAPPPVQVAPKPAPPPDPKPPVDPTAPRPPSHLDRAKKSGSSALEDGPADVTALELAPDNNTLAIG